MRKATIIVLALSMSLFLGTCSKQPTALEEVLSSGELRVITRNSPTTYYRGATGFDGPEYQLVHGFARFLSERYAQRVDVSFATVDSFSELLPTLERGRAHVAAAGLTVTEDRKQQVSFGPSYQKVKQHLVYKLNTGKPRKLEDLEDKTLRVMAGSTHAQTLQDIRYVEPLLEWTETNAAEVSELLMAVADQSIDYTVADSNAFNVHRHYMPDLRIAMDLTREDKLAWAFPLYHSTGLQELAAEYFAEIRENGDLERLLDRYYGHTDDFDYADTRTFIRHVDSRLVNYRPMFEEAAAATGTDWRLLAAIAYQESHWDPAAVSPTGVKGMMMLTKATAKRMGVADRRDPAQAIPGGAEYFAYLRGRLRNIPEPDRGWFALAAYNVGYGHLLDARTLVRRAGGDPNNWLEVREALPKLAIRKWYNTVPRGYARGWEPVGYVNNVRSYYEVLCWLTQDEMEVPATDEDAGTITASRAMDFLRWL